MASDIKQLFLDKFILFNLDRYEENAEALALIQGLTLADVVIGSVSDVEGEAGKKVVSLSSATRRFTAADQRFTRADIENPVVTTTINPGEPLADAAALAEVEVPGLYLYLDGAVTKIAVVYPHGTAVGDVNAAVANTIISGCNYTLTSDFISVDAGVATVNADYITGSLIVREAARVTFVIPATDYGKLGTPL